MDLPSAVFGYIDPTFAIVNHQWTDFETGPSNVATAELVEYFWATTQVHQVHDAVERKSVRSLIYVSSMQHYPDNNCGLGGPPPSLDYFIDHSNSRCTVPT